MKKHVLLALFGLLALLLQSCTVNSDITYHKDAASSVLLDLEFKELMAMMKAQGGDDAKDLEDIDKLPKTWTSFYDMQLKEGKKVSQHPDSIRLMKKMFMKGNFDGEEISGISMKFDRFSKQDYIALRNFSDKGASMPLNDSNFLTNWDGKKLTIDTDQLSLKDFEKIMSKGAEEEGEGAMDAEQSKAIMQMMMKKYTMNLKFETDIKSITGKHDWIKQIDKRTVQIDFDTSNLDESKKFSHKDKQVVITTE